MFRKQPLSLSAADTLKIYLADAVLPPMTHGSSAPPMPPAGHKAHLNHLAIRPEDYRSRFAKIITPKAEGLYDKAVLSFSKAITCEQPVSDTNPSEELDLPIVDDKTGYAFTMPAPGYGIQPPSIPRPTNIQEVAPWVLTVPLQTMTRALHVAFPEARNWDITYVNRDDPDSTLWNTLVWRKTPPPSNIETFWIQPTDPLEHCSVVFVIQPPWIMTPQDLKSFVRCSSLPPFNAWDPDENRPFKSAERVWGKLWDTCVRRSCHHWVLTTYWGWVFGAFSEGFTAGQVLEVKNHDANGPNVLQCLVYHVASSMGLATGSALPQYLESLDSWETNMDIPEASRDVEILFTDSDSEWDGCDEEPGISAGVSQLGGFALSAWGSEQDFGPNPVSRVPLLGGRRGHRMAPLAPDKAARLMQWQNRVDSPPPHERRSPSPTISETGQSGISVFRSAQRAGSEFPDIEYVSRNGTGGYGNFLRTVPEQGPEEGSDS